MLNILVNITINKMNVPWIATASVELGFDTMKITKYTVRMFFKSDNKTVRQTTCYRIEFFKLKTPCMLTVVEYLPLQRN